MRDDALGKLVGRVGQVEQAGVVARHIKDVGTVFGCRDVAAQTATVVLTFVAEIHVVDQFAHRRRSGVKRIRFQILEAVAGQIQPRFTAQQVLGVDRIGHQRIFPALPLVPVADSIAVDVSRSTAQTRVLLVKIITFLPGIRQAVIIRVLLVRLPCSENFAADDFPGRRSRDNPCHGTMIRFVRLLVKNFEIIPLALFELNLGDLLRQQWLFHRFGTTMPTGLRAWLIDTGDKPFALERFRFPQPKLRRIVGNDHHRVFPTGRSSEQTTGPCAIVIPAAHRQFQARQIAHFIRLRRKPTVAGKVIDVATGNITPDLPTNETGSAFRISFERIRARDLFLPVEQLVLIRIAPRAVWTIAGLRIQP